jgi:hypothetical protein
MRVNRDSIAAIDSGFCNRSEPGFWKTHGPSAQRLIRADVVLVALVVDLVRKLLSSALPSQATARKIERRHAGPVTGKPPDYITKPPSSYMLCTTFATDSPKEELKGTFDFWTHPAGSKCFEFHAGDPVPQAPYFFYY